MRFRRSIAAVIAVATLSTGSAACTPQQAADAGHAFNTLIRSMLAAWMLSFIPPIPVPTSVPSTTLPV